MQAASRRKKNLARGISTSSPRGKRANAPRPVSEFASDSATAPLSFSDLICSSGLLGGLSVPFASSLLRSSAARSFAARPGGADALARIWSISLGESWRRKTRLLCLVSFVGDSARADRTEASSVRRLKRRFLSLWSSRVSQGVYIDASQWTTLTLYHPSTPNHEQQRAPFPSPPVPP